jgi:heat shock protein HslJ
MKNIRLSLLWLSLFFTLSAEKCSKTAAPVDALTALTGSQWNLTSLAGQALKLPDGVKTPFLSLAKDGKLSGFGGCNQLMGSMKLEGTALSFPGLGGTKMFCEGAQPTENAFMSALRSTNSFKLDGDKLMLLEGAHELATLVKQ